MCFMVIEKICFIEIFINKKIFIMQLFAIVCLLIEITKEKSTVKRNKTEGKWKIIEKSKKMILNKKDIIIVMLLK